MKQHHIELVLFGLISVLVGSFGFFSGYQYERSQLSPQIEESRQAVIEAIQLIEISQEWIQRCGGQPKEYQ